MYLCFFLLFACTVTVTMCADPVKMVTKDTMRRWVVRARPGTVTETTDREKMARDLAEQYGLEGHQIGALHEWFVFNEKEGAKPLEENSIRQLKESDHFSDVRLEVGRNRVTKT